LSALQAATITQINQICEIHDSAAKMAHALTRIGKQEGIPPMCEARMCEARKAPACEVRGAPPVTA